MMSGIKSKDTKPEILLRKSLFNKGLRYRKNYKQIFGTPDIAFVSKKAVIFVHGCFWHGHNNKNCKLSNIPKSNTEFWLRKIQRNHDRDTEVLKELTKEGVRYLIVWECTMKGKGKYELSKLTNYVYKWVIAGSQNIQISGGKSTLEEGVKIL